MKILILYFSNTGNTEKVAKAIQEGLINYKVDFIPLKDANPNKLKDIDLMFLGSGVYASRASNALIKFISKASELPTKIALFCTHQSLDFYQKPFNKLDKTFQKYGATIVEEFDCVGENLGMSKEDRMKMIGNLPSEKQEQAIKLMEQSKGRPNEEDLNNAKKFAQEVIKNL